MHCCVRQGVALRTSIHLEYRELSGNTLYSTDGEDDLDISNDTKVELGFGISTFYDVTQTMSCLLTLGKHSWETADLGSRSS